MFPFLRTFKPMLKRARGTKHYEDIRLLLQLWLHCRRVTSLLQNQNDKLLIAAKERDLLLSIQRGMPNNNESHR